MSEPTIIGNSASHEVRLAGGQALSRRQQARGPVDGIAPRSGAPVDATEIANKALRPEVARADDLSGASAPGSPPLAAASDPALPRSPIPIDYSLPRDLRARMDRLRSSAAELRTRVAVLPQPAQRAGGEAANLPIASQDNPDE